jgi:hypothetical protein
MWLHPCVQVVAHDCGISPQTPCYNGFSQFHVSQSKAPDWMKMVCIGPAKSEHRIRLNIVQSSNDLKRYLQICSKVASVESCGQ